jgi:hypothetical protein
VTDRACGTLPEGVSFHNGYVRVRRRGGAAPRPRWVRRGPGSAPRHHRSRSFRARPARPLYGDHRPARPIGPERDRVRHNAGGAVGELRVQLGGEREGDREDSRGEDRESRGAPQGLPGSRPLGKTAANATNAPKRTPLPQPLTQGRARRLRCRGRAGTRRGRPRGHPSEHRGAPPRRPARAIGPHHRAADLPRARRGMARRAGSGEVSADQDGAPSAREMWGLDVNTPRMTATKRAPRPAIARPCGALTRPRTRSPHQVAVHRPTTNNA